MNFQNLKNVEPAQTYLDIAFRSARTKDRPAINKKADRVKLIKTYEFNTIQTVFSSLSKHLRNIIRSFPKTDELPEFYIELLKVCLDYSRLKKSLGGVNWAEKKINTLYNDYSVRVKKATAVPNIVKIRREFYGRVSSVLKQIKNELSYIEQSRRTMKNFPCIKTDLYTIAIAGYPNVGKSSLLKALTNANPEIKDYAFTTKSLNMGYFTLDNEKIQLIDTPGAFDRDVKDMNMIEKQAYLTIKHVSDLIYFVLDPTECCGYSLKEQKKLILRIKSMKKDMIILYNKCDLGYEQAKANNYISTKTGEGITELLKLTQKHKSNRKEEDYKS